MAALVGLIRAVARREPPAGYAIETGTGRVIGGLPVIETWRGPRLTAHVVEDDGAVADAADLAGTGPSGGRLAVIVTDAAGPNDAMPVQSSRLAARIDSHGALVPLPRQDRSLWDRGRIAAGIETLAAAGEGSRAGEYHLLAGIAACHAAAESYAATDWARIARLYDELAARGNNFVIEVNRAVAVAHVEGPAAGMAALASIDDARSEDYYLLAAARADLLGEGEARPGAAAGFEGSPRRAPDRGRAAVFLVSGGGVSLGGRTLGGAR